MSESDLISSEFPVKKELIYLAHAAVSPLPESVAEKIREYASEYSRISSTRFLNYWLPMIDETRKLAAELLNCSPSEIALGRSTTWGLILASLELPFRAGDEILIHKQEFPANIYPWLPLENRGVKVKMIESSSFCFTAADFEKHLSRNTKAVSVSTVQYLSGYRADLEEISRFCHENDLFLILDAIQSLGAFHLDTSVIRADFISADAHKWLLGPEGISILYISGKTIPQLNGNYRGWLGVDDPMDFKSCPMPPCQGARRYEEGALNIAGIAALNASLKLVLSTGIKRISELIIRNSLYLIRELESAGYEIVTPHSKKNQISGIVCFRPHSCAETLVKKLEERKIIVNSRNNLVRISPHFYNDLSELEQFIIQLKLTDT